MRKILTDYLLFLLAILALFLCGCGSVKKSVKTDTAVHTIVAVDSAKAGSYLVSTKTYGDTLVGVGFIPVSALKDTTSASDDSLINFSLHSTGISLSGTFKPVYKNNQLTGLKTDYSAIAKPVTVTNTSKTEQVNVHATIKKDSTAQVQSTTTTHTGLRIPWWCWLLAAGLLAILIRWLIKSLPINF
ncbi:hypothetical protein ACFS5N_16280 [Mucilaginibacter ximonensis]|uniref:Lipoprotein n=1 Tax=Mucilaginibacter ximonensis TaxID=538021 RepID=A0ABW5YFK9_9SPHI